MSGITTGIGIFSGIDTATLIDQLLAVEARPRLLAQNRIIELQTQQGAYLDINSRLSALQSSARSFRTEFVFEAMQALSTNTDSLSATASRSAVPGSYQFLVDRLVSSQQMLSRGFSNASSSAIGADSFTFESARGRLDTDIALADLNDGQGVERGKIVINQGSESATVDLSKAITINDVLDAINASGLDVTATASGDGFELTGGTDFTVSNATGYTTAESLGIAGNSTSGTLTGDSVYQLSASTALSQLNDGNGVFIGTDFTDSTTFARHDFTILIDAGASNLTEVDINLGEVWEEDDEGEYVLVEGAVTSMQGVVDRINGKFEELGLSLVGQASLQNGDLVIENLYTPGTQAIEIEEKDEYSTTAADLGLSGSATGSLTADRVLAGLGTTLVKTLNGGQGLDGNGQIFFTKRDGTSFNVDVSSAETVDELMQLVNDATLNFGEINMSLNAMGTGFTITDSSGGTGNLQITGDTATALGIAGDVAESTIEGTSAQHQYVSMSTLLDDMNNGKGIGTGEFRVTDGDGVSFRVNIGSDSKNVYDLIEEMQGQADAAGANINVRLNDKGDGIIVEEKGGVNFPGAAPIAIEDISGSVASNLRIEGEASGTDGDNVLDGSAEVIVDFDATDTLEEIAQKINDANGSPVRATIINDGTGSNPYRLSFSARESGVDGRFVMDDGGLGLDLRTLNAGEDSVVFYGSDDPATAVLLTNSSNTLDDVIPGVTIDLNATSDEVVELTISRDTEGVIGAIEGFIAAFNDTLSRIDFQSRYDAETEISGPLLGDSTLSLLRSNLSRTVLGEPIGVDDEYSRFSQVGITVGEGGQLEFDRDTFRDALEQDYQAVYDLFAAREQTNTDSEVEIEDGVFVSNNQDAEFSRLGLIFQFEELADIYLDSVNGIFTNKEDTINDQIALQEDRIEQYNVLLDNRRITLEMQFLAMEEALASLSTQQSALASLAG